MQKIDNNRERVTFYKLAQLSRLLLPTNSRTLKRLAKFNELDLDELSDLAGHKIKGLILDADDTIAIFRGRILKQNVQHIEKLLKKGCKIVIYSNMHRTDRYNVLPKEVLILTNIPAKPDPEGFRIALKALELKANEVAMVGDSYISDAGCLRIGIPFVHVKPIHWEGGEEWISVSILRYLYEKISRFYDLFRKLKH